MNEVPRRASRVDEDAQEQRPRARRRLTTGSAGDSEQEYNTSEALGSSVELEVRANSTPEKAPAAEAPPKNTAAKQYQVDLVPAWVAKRYSQSSVRPPLPSVMARKYELWKDDLDFVAERETYWGTVAPRLADLRLESRQSAEDGEEQEEHRLSCTPCLDQGRECSKEMPICAQCRSEEAPAMCSYHVDRAYVPDSKRQGATKKKRRILDANLAVALEYLDGAMDDIEDEDLSNNDPSNDDAWKVGVQGERDPHEGADSAVKESAKSDWLAKALFADDEGRGYHGPAKVPRKRGRPWKLPPGEKQPVKIKRSVGRPRKDPTEEEPVKIKRSWNVGMKDEELLEPARSVSREKVAVKMAILKAERKGKNEDKNRGKGKGKLKDMAKAAPQRRGFNGRVMERYLKDTTRKLNALGTWTEAHKSPTGDQGQERSEVIAESGVKDESDGETATPVVTKYKEQIANTFRPWVAQKDEKVIPSACGLPDTSLLQALHYYASYYYTHVSPSPDMFEAMDMTSHVALGMIVQEIISDFAFKLGKDSQLEDIQVKVDKLVAAQYGDKWDKDFLGYLESRTADRSLPLNQPAKKRRHSGLVDRSVESADDGGPDTDIGEDDDMSHDSRTWDELEELRRTTISLGVGTVKELVNRTRFDISVEETLEMGLDGEETGRRSASPLRVDSDLDSSDDLDTGSTSAGNGGWLTQSTLTSSKETPFKIALGNDSEVSLSGEEDTEMPVRDSTRGTTHGSEVATLDQGDYDMPEIDFSPSILTQLSNNRFRSQPAFGLDDSSSDDDDGSDELDGPTLVRSQSLLEDSYESSEVESGSSESDSEQEEKATDEKDKEAKDKATGEEDDKKEESEKDVDSDKGGHIQEDYDDAYGASNDDSISPSVLTQVSATRFGSAFKLSQDELVSEEDDIYNPSGGRFVVQSQVVQDDSDNDSSEVSSDSDSGQEEQDEESEEKDTIAAKDAGDNKPTKEDHLEDHIAAETKEDSAPIKKDHAEDDDEVEEEEEVVSEIARASNHEEGDAEPIELPKRLSGRAIEEFSVEMETAEVTTAAGTVDETSTREQSRAGSEADVDMPSGEEYKTREFLTKKDDRLHEEEEEEEMEEEHNIRETLMEKDDRSNEKEQEEDEAKVEEDKGDPSQPVYMVVSATRFGSRFSASYNADDGDESEEEGTAYSFGTQSQVVYDDSTTSEEENVQSSSESDSD
ncbi:hypothetical protein KI688_000483 [Linnemannia hyalina]|uniref:Uncharacterized protein n=1 Tax=Linnemannia hyalina TaxID=64524 RepID=A0A9P7Y5I6_9FUNG|nr:hypothetical protein KI688_000483 [Linnemannia hyalina]